MNVDPLGFVENGPAEELSPLGASRKAEILWSLEATMKRRAAVRTAGKASLVVLVLAAVPIIGWIAMAGGSQTPSAVHSPDAKPIVTVPNAALPANSPMIAMVRTDDNIVERLAAPKPQNLVRILTDRELQNLLASRGTAAGLVRIGDRVLLAVDMQRSEESDPAPRNDTSS